MEPDTEHGTSDGDGTVVTLAGDAPPVLVGDRFEVGERLGSGAAATVHRAHDRVLGRDVAVKLFAPGVGTLRSGTVRRELQAATQVSHPGVLEVFDVGEATAPDGTDRVFLVMRLVPGGSLADTLESGPLPAEVVVGLASELLAALAHVHALGIVHRDVKPANILLDPVDDGSDGSDDGAGGPARVHPVLADFGVAALATATTVHGQVTGTAAYLAPEQVRGDEVGSPADVYALGLVLLECLTGRREFPGGPVESSVARLHRDPVVPADLPDDLRDLLTAMTAAAPVERPSAEAARARLRALAPVLGLDEETLAVPAAALGATGGLPGRSPIVIGPAVAASPSPGDSNASLPASSAGNATSSPAPRVPLVAAGDLPTGPIAVPARPGGGLRRGLLGAAAVLVLAGGVVGGIALTGSSSPLTSRVPDPVPAAPVLAAPGAPAVASAPPAGTDPAAADPAVAVGADPADQAPDAAPDAVDDPDGGDSGLPQEPAPAAPPGAPPAPAPPAACRSVVSSLAGGGATVRIVFTNRGDAACTLRGFPAVSFVAGGKTVGRPASRAGARGAALTLAPGGSVAATLRIVPVKEFDAKNCRAVDVSGLRVRAPGTRAAATLPRAGKACSGTVAKPQLRVATVRAL